MGWNDERVELLKKLWNEGLSASQIAARLGGVTRNAVIGKVHRLGLSGRVTPTRTLGARRPRNRENNNTAPRRLRPRTIAPAGTLARSPWQWDSALQPEGLPEVVEELFIPLDERKSVLDLKEGDCRWPIGDPQNADFHFCGKQKHAAFVYCEFHARKAYQPPQAMRRRDREPGQPGFVSMPIKKITAA